MYNNRMLKVFSAQASRLNKEFKTNRASAQIQVPMFEVIKIY